MAAGQRARGLLELLRTHVVRRRVDEIAREPDALRDAAEVVAVDVAGQLQLQLFLVLLAIAREPVAAERQQAAERPRPEQVLVRIVGAFEREQDAGKPALRPRQEQVTARLRL